MSGVLGHVFGCCRRSKRLKAAIPDEESRLIPEIPTEDQVIPPIPPTLVIVDQQKLKDKLEVIVRDTEGKMVNLNSHIPFNLHNQTLSAALGPSSSRSASTSTHPRNSGLITYGAITPTSSRQGSPSRSSSISDSAFLDDHARLSKGPILNVRLVRRPSDTSSLPRRGRTRIRGSASAASVHSPPPPSPEEPFDIKGKDRDLHAHHGLGLNLNVDVDKPENVITGLDSESDLTPNAKTFAQRKHPTITTSLVDQPASSGSQQPFKIKNPGALSLSWGD